MTRLIDDTNNALYHNKLYYTLQVQQKRIILIYFSKSNAHISSFFLVFTQNLSNIVLILEKIPHPMRPIDLI